MLIYFSTLHAKWPSCEVTCPMGPETSHDCRFKFSWMGTKQSPTMQGRALSYLAYCFTNLSTICAVSSGKSTMIFLSSAIHLFRWVPKVSLISATTGTPSLEADKALHCCSYWPFIGIIITFFCKNSASAGPSKPPPVSRPSQLARLLLKASLFTGKISTLPD